MGETLNKLKLYRKRFVPNETIFLKDDKILYQDEDKIITKWRVFRPKENFDHGVSCYYLKQGYKVSKFLNEKNELVYYYCDIIDTEYNAEDNTYIFSDLLADVIVFENGFVKVVDLVDRKQKDLLKLVRLLVSLTSTNLNLVLTVVLDGKKL